VEKVQPEAHLHNIKESVRTEKKTQHFTITKINWLMLFREIKAVYSENRTKLCCQNAELVNVKRGGQ
jgi:hypothetical protein